MVKFVIVVVVMIIIIVLEIILVEIVVFFNIRVLMMEIVWLMGCGIWILVFCNILKVNFINSVFIIIGNGIFWCWVVKLISNGVGINSGWKERNVINKDGLRRVIKKEMIFNMCKKLVIV